MSIHINVDPTNPGQLFACCGLLELAHRLWPGAEGWFSLNARQFHIASTGTMEELLQRLASAKINSSLTDPELKRLGRLLSAKKANLTPAQIEEKLRLSDLWKRERLHLSKPFDLWVDWWSNDHTGAKGMKTWAAKTLVVDVARSLLAALAKLNWADHPIEDCLCRTADVEGLPFYFDSDANSQNTPRDTGFGLYTLRKQIKTRASTRPLLELAAFFGIQRFRPALVPGDNLFCLSAWTTPLPVTVAGAATTGLFSFPGERRYAFRMLKRSEYMKAFLPAKPYQGA